MIAGLFVLALIVVGVSCLEGKYAEAAWFSASVLLLFLFLWLFL